MMLSARSGFGSLLTAACLVVGGQGAPANEPAAPASAPAKDPVAFTSKVDQLFAPWDKPGSPGCALAIIKDGRIIYKRGYGLANLEYRVPITPSTIFHVASVSKQFTAMAVIMLAQEGKLSLDDDIRKYIPELQDFGTTITPHHLMYHTSGLRDQWEILQFAGWRMDDVILERDILQLLWQQRELNFAPGERHLYCNSGYTLLGVLVHRLSGQTLAEFCRERIFKPLGMNSTHFHDDYRMIVPNRAYSYDRRRWGSFRNSVLSFGNTGATSLFTTVEDLARWDQNFYDAAVGGKAAIDEMLRKGKLSNGAEIAYAGGLVIGDYRGLPVIEHAGADAGFRSVLIRFPRQRFSVVILANLATVPPTDLARWIADIYLADQTRQPKPPAQTRPSSRASSSADPITTPPATTQSAAGQAAPTLPMEQYTGDFYSPELSAIYNVRIEGGQLVLRHRKDQQPLVAVAGDDFRTHFSETNRASDNYVQVRFSRDDQGKINGFTVSNDRVKRLRFVRIELPR